MDAVIRETSSLSEEEIIKRIINGESDLFEQLVSKYNSSLYQIAGSFGINHQNAEDIFQDTQIAVFCKLSQFKFKSTFKTWLSKIMIHKCLYNLKLGYKKYEECACLKDKTIDCCLMGSAFESGEIIFLKKELKNLIQKTIKKLPFDYETVFVLREVEGRSVAETASLLNISDINVRVRLNRAKNMLQKKLKAINNF